MYSPKGYPDIVYVGGSYSYGQTVANKRGVVLSTDAGVSATDMTFDGTDSLHPNGLHPDQHALVTNPNNPLQFFESNDDANWWRMPRRKPNATIEATVVMAYHRSADGDGGTQLVVVRLQ